MKGLVKTTKVFFKRNSQTILTCIGAIGVVTTAVMAVKATPKAMQLLEEAKHKKGEELTTIETIRVAGPAYIPSILMGASTIACIFGANALNKQSQAALTSAYAMLDMSYKEYKKKVRELHGEEANSKIKEEIARDNYEEIDVPLSKEKALFFDYFSMRFFESTLEDVLSAEYRFNQNFMMSGSACLNELYDMLGLARIDAGYQLGWVARSENKGVGCSSIKFELERVKLDEFTEGYILSIENEPTEDYIY